MIIYYWCPVKSTALGTMGRLRNIVEQALGPMGRLRNIVEQEGAKDHRRGCKPPVKSHTV
jgi:hypothetical protein